MSDWITAGILVLVVGGFGFLEARALRRWQGKAWRVAAGIPLIAVGLVALNIVVGTAMDPTSHNLWPLELLMWIGGGLGYLVLLTIVHKLTAGRAATG